MITIFNRKELILTCSMERQGEIRGILGTNHIDYTIKTSSRSGMGIFPTSRARTGSLGINMDCAYQYTIYVKKQDYEYAKSLIM